MSVVWPIFLTELIYSFVNSFNGSARIVIFKEKFKLSQYDLGNFLSAAFFVNTIVGMRLKEITTFLGGPNKSIKWGLIILTIGYILNPLVYSLKTSTKLGHTPYVCVSLALFIFQFPMSTTLTALSTAQVEPELKGTLVGLQHAAFSIASLLAPTAGWIVFQLKGTRGISYTTIAIFIIILGFWLGKVSKFLNKKQTDDQETVKKME